MTVSVVPHDAHSGTGTLSGKVALVTGGARGIGAAISRRLAGDGASVAVGYRRDRGKALAVAEEMGAGYRRDRGRALTIAEEMAAGGAGYSVHQGHVGSAYDCERVIREVLDHHGRLDILVNNAGITVDRPVLKMGAEDWNEVVSVNLSGAFYLSKPALEHMIDRGSGRIVSISSIIGQIGNIGQANYAASKAGLFGLTMTMAREAAHALHKAGTLDEDGPGLTVNAIAPGFIDTEMVAAVPERALERIKQQIPLKRLGRPDDVARVVAFLCHDESSYITGQILAVNGGMEM